MKKYCLVLFFFISFVFCFAQGFDDMAFPNPDMMTYLQQEMTSLMRFQFENDIYIPFFASLSLKIETISYNNEYLSYLHAGNPQYIKDIIEDYSYHKANYFDKSNGMLDIFTGVQVKINRGLYIPVFFCLGGGQGDDYIGEWVYKSYHSENYRVPLKYHFQDFNTFLATGVTFNTDMVRFQRNQSV